MLGGGSTPQQTLPTTLIAFDRDAVVLERALRGSNPPVVARIDEDRLLIDLRTVHPREEHALAAALRAALSATSPG
jgi:L-seryl-tRNA(Ser) seleniumtransferase